MKNRKMLKILVISILTITLVVAFGLFKYKSIATATNEMVSVGIGDPPNFPYVTYNDLIEMYNILCSQKGTHLTGTNGATVTQGDKSSIEGYLKNSDIGKKLFESTQDASGYTTNESFSSPYTSTTSSTYGLYEKSDAINCSPSEAYVLSEMSENTYGNSSSFYNITNKEYKGKVTDDIVVTIGGVPLYGINLDEDEYGELMAGDFVTKGSDGKYYYVEMTSDSSYFPYTYVQYAWWSTKAGGSTTVKATSLQKEAEAFEEYINKVAKRNSSGDIVTESKNVTVNGKKVTVTAPVIDYKIGKHADEAKSYYDENEKKFLVGPFSIDYYEESITSDRGTINFSGITGATLKSNLGEVNKSDWKFAFPERSDDVKDKSSYPHSGEKFYVVVNYKEGMTQINDLHFTFQYMNAGGQYEKLTGDYLKASWEPESEPIWCDEDSSYCECGGTSVGPHGDSCKGGAKACSHGFYHKHIIKWKYWLELKDLDASQSQTLAEGLVGARWYENAEVSLIATPEDTVDVSGTKIWEDNDNKDGKRPSKVVVTLYRNGKKTDKTREVSASNGWKYEFKNLPKTDSKGETIVYTVVETGVTGYTTTYDGYNIINTPDTIDVSGTKTWNDNENKDKKRPSKVIVTLYRNGKKTDNTKEITAENNWKYEFKGLPKYDNNGESIIYTVVETGVTGYTTTYKGYDMVNTPGPETIDILGTKTWADDNNKDGKRPTSITLTLYKNGKKTDQTRVADVSNNWKYEFKNLPKYDDKGEEIAYTVVETKVSGYITIYSGYDMINIPDTVNISGTKTWDDSNNKDGKRPSKVVVTLYKNGVKTTQTREITEKDNWKYEFRDLPKYDDKGNMIVYTVIETAVTGYTTIYSGYDIRNTITVDGIKLTIPMAGEVWIDTDPDKAHDTKYGYKDNGEKPYEKAEVYVYKVYLDKDGKELKRELAKIYADDNTTEIKFPVYTDAKGQYKINNILVPGTEEEKYKDCTIKYDVVFAYDGQNYEASDFLPTSKGNAKTYMSASKEERKKYEKDSMAIEDATERDTFNKKFTEISGSKPIDDKGNTEGKSTGEGKTYKLDYTSKEYKLSPESTDSRRISTLTTTNKDGYILDQYKMNASTGKAGLIYPFANKISIETADDVKEISVKVEDGIKMTTYKTLYEYMLHINLAVKERDEADLAVGKDLYKAQLVVNEKALTYKYNTLYDFEDEKNKDLLKIQLEAAKAKPYTLGLYSSDYAYRSKIYSKTADVIKSIKHDTELRAFLTYKVVAYNESEGYDEIINQLNDYYDSTFTLIKDDLSVNVLNDKGVRESKVVAEKTYYRIVPGMEVAKYKYNSKEDIAKYPSGNITWKEDSTFKESSDYKKMTTDSLKNIKLKPGERVEIFVTFEVDKAGFLNKDSKERKQLLGEKNNIAEIANYSTYYKDGKVAGRIDKDSAPDNIDFKKNKKSWYEDDTESAPVINIELYNANRELNGLVWEDAETNELKYKQKVGNGIYDSGEKGISNLDVELVEKISIDDVEYEYIWPIDAFKGTVAEKNYNSTDVTKEGKYTFKGFVAGNYVVRFKYGNRDDSIQYNGQDYKNTAYQANIKNSDGTVTLNNEWHDLTDKTLKEAKVSDARDYELQRMKVIAYSRKITNKEGTVLETADNKSIKHDELIKNTQMVANTAKLNLEVERQDYIDYGTEKTVDGIKEYTYIVNDIDFGLEKRSETVMELKKDLYSITLYKNNGTSQIMKVVIKDDGTYDFDVSEELAKLLRVAKTKTEQGFSYINMESEYLKDLTIKLEYKITVENKSEVDWTGLLVEFDDIRTAKEDILAEVQKLEEDKRYVSGKDISYGDYVGLNYYNNQNNDSDKIVTTKIEKLIDYIDTNISINTAETSAVENSAWVNISTDKLKSENLLDSKVYTTLEDGSRALADENGNIYDTEVRKNVYVTDEAVYNKKMITELVPETAKDIGTATSGEIMIVTSKTTTSEETASDLNFDNIAEILIYSNTVGRRDEEAVPGNAEIARGAFTAATGVSEEDGKVVTEYKGAKDIKVDGTEYSLNGERDTDAAEFVTFTDPTGYNGRTGFNSNIEYLIAISIGCIILAGGIIAIKLKVVDVNNDKGIKKARKDK